MIGLESADRQRAERGAAGLREHRLVDTGVEPVLTQAERVLHSGG